MEGVGVKLTFWRACPGVSPCCRSNGTGYKIKLYQAQVRRRGKNVHLGYCATAEEAALCYARTPEAQATQPPPASSKKRKVKSEEQPPDVPADVVVILEGRLVESTAFE